MKFTVFHTAFTNRVSGCWERVKRGVCPHESGCSSLLPQYWLCWERGVEKRECSTIFFKRTRKVHHQSHQHWKMSQRQHWGSYERQGRAKVHFLENGDAILNLILNKTGFKQMEEGWKLQRNAISTKKLSNWQWFHSQFNFLSVIVMDDFQISSFFFMTGNNFRLTKPQCHNPFTLLD